MTNKQRFPYAYKKIVRKHKDLKVRKTSIQTYGFKLLFRR